MRFALAVSALVLFAAGSARAARLEVVSGEIRVVETKARTEGVELAIEVRDRCAASFGKDVAEVVCSEWYPLVATGEARKLAFRGTADLADGSTKTANLKASGSGGGAYSVVASPSPGVAWPLVAKDEPGRWLVPAARLGQLLVVSDGGGLPEQLRLAGQRDDAPLVNEEQPLSIAAGVVAPHTGAWRCAAMGDPSALYAVLDGGTAMDALLQEIAGATAACPDQVDKALATVCAEAPRVEVALSRAASLQELLDRRLDVRALVTRCGDAPKEGLRKAGDLAREYLVTTQRGADLVSFLGAYGDLLGAQWQKVSEDAAAELLLSETRKSGDVAPLQAFLARFPETERRAELGAALLELSGKIDLPCEGSRRRCEALPVGATLTFTWSEGGSPASAALVGWSRDAGALPLHGLFDAWAVGAEPSRVQAAVAALQGQGSPGRWSLQLPYTLRSTPDPRQDGYALQLSIDGAEPVLLPFSLTSRYDEFDGRSRLVLLREGAVDLQLEPGADLLRAAAVEVHATQSMLVGDHLITWTGPNDSGEALLGPVEPIGAVAVDVVFGGIAAVLQGQPVAAVHPAGRSLLIEAGAGCNERTALTAGLAFEATDTPCSVYRWDGDELARKVAEGARVATTARHAAVAILTTERGFALLDAEGQVSPLSLSPGASAGRLALSPDGTRLATALPGGLLELRGAGGLVERAGAPEDCGAATGCRVRWDDEFPVLSCQGDPATRCGPWMGAPGAFVAADVAGRPAAGSNLGIRDADGELELLVADGRKGTVVTSTSRHRAGYKAPRCAGGAPMAGLQVQALDDGAHLLVHHQLRRCDADGTIATWGPVELLSLDGEQAVLVARSVPGLGHDAASAWASDLGLAIDAGSRRVGGDEPLPPPAGVARVLWYRPSLERALR